MEKGIKMAKKKQAEINTVQPAQFDKKFNINSYMDPAFAEMATASDVEPSSTSNRTSRGRPSTGTTSLSNLLPFVNSLPDPFNYTSSGGGYVDIRDLIMLVERAFFSFAPLRHTIETQVELANDEIFLKGANKQARTFISKWLEKIGIWRLGDQFYRGYFLPANVYLYRFDATLSKENLNKLQTVYGKNLQLSEAAVKLPIKYVMLDPACIARLQGLNYENEFVKVLTRAEIQKIKSPKTDEEKEFVSQFSSKELAEIKKSGYNGAKLKLDPNRLYYSAYKRQDYQPFGIPFAFSVLQDIDYKLLLKKLDREIAKTFDFAILHFKVGIESNGQLLINASTITNLQSLFVNPKLQRVLVTGMDVDGKWLVPPIDTLLGEAKYKAVNDDIKAGLLSSILDENSKFASLSIKVQVLIQRLQEARQAFLKDFLEPEIKRVCGLMGFRSYPVPYFTDINLEDPTNFRKIVLRLLELGYLTPENMEEAIVKGVFPNMDEVLEYQEKFKKQKEDGLWQPQLNRKEDAAEPGRPGGTGTPQSTKKPGKIGTKASFNFKKLAENLVEFAKLKEGVAKKLKKDFAGAHEDFDGLVFNTSQAISLTENRPEWYNSIASYLKNPTKPDKEKLDGIKGIMEEFDVEDEEQATALLLSKE